MSTRAERVRCFYCGDPVAPGRVEQDHFPIPASCGGTQTVAACIQCHDLKDRTSWETLPVEFKGAFMEQFASMEREAKIVFAQFMRVAMQAKALAESKTSAIGLRVGDRFTDEKGTWEIVAQFSAGDYRARRLRDDEEAD